MSRYDWERVEQLREERDDLVEALDRAYCSATARHQGIMQYLTAHHPKYARAFRVPESTDGTQVVGTNGKAIGPNYLLGRWLKGQDAGPFNDELDAGQFDDELDAGPFKSQFDIRLSGNIWKMNRAARLAQSETWKREVVKKGIKDMLQIGKRYNRCVTDLESVYRQGQASVLRERRIIGCTTTGAAMYRSERFMFNRYSLY